MTKFFLNVGSPIKVDKIIQNDEELNYTIENQLLTIYHSKNPDINFDTHPITIYYSIKLSFNPKEKRGIYVYDDNYITHLGPIYARYFYHVLMSLASVPLFQLKSKFRLFQWPYQICQLNQ